MNQTKLTLKEIKEYATPCLWMIKGDQSNDPIVEFNSFAEIEHKYFEGYNLPYLIIKENEKLEPFEKACDRMKKYYKLSFETRKLLRNPDINNIINIIQF